ncbi:DUF2244 domain-containing protein [Marinobacter sp. BGYM27]|uniref:DUF2244 domain-containing protein n=1 Tax=unclassified Marinobacter TaxID=83889 RepID=UPI0021A7FDA9|nr:DUF2244 domain-containing protein [Marinobacter sp. BGYM27]MDG5499538.1 DUF2244 domain-containing protein [Marinobacter sp. BGYM27]
MVQQLPNESGIRLLLAPNRSLSWRGNVRIWLVLCAVSLLISIGMLTAGAWVVLPFAGLEVLAVGAGFYYTARQCQRQEVLTFSDNNLRLEKGVNHIEASWDLPRHYTRLKMTEPRHVWTPRRLFLVCRDLEIPLAPFLNLDDIKALTRILEREGLRIQHQPVTSVF